jgi:tellurite resistance protein TerC
VVLVWLSFLAFILLLLALDLGVFHRNAHVVSVKEGLVWSVVWMALSGIFAVFVWAAYDHQWFGLGLSPDPIERSAAFPLGVPNNGEIGAGEVPHRLCRRAIAQRRQHVRHRDVVSDVCGAGGVPHRVLFWGILGALAMRGVMIAAGAALVANFAWTLKLFGAFLVFTAIKMLVVDVEEQDPRQNPVVRLARKYLPVTKRYHGQHFMLRRAGRVFSHRSRLPSSWWRPPTCCSRWTRFPQSSRSPPIRSWCSRVTRSPFSVCARSISCWRVR